MIATHTPKMFNARLKQKALRARIINDVPPSIICSQSVNMSHDNRGRLAVDPDGNWRLYQPAPLLGWEALGTVTRGVGDTGALVRNLHTGMYAQANAGAIRSLDQRRIGVALKATQEG